ncbi:hypothetical protein J4558_06550 [Leptolyngbya sp. 15MV]|nr:hypothetical protein J4558_06550 [Leptolyngbya sp. 15MV]
MATSTAPQVPIGEGPERADVAVQRTWRKGARLSSMADRIEGFLAQAGFDRGPWLTIAFAGGIAAWFVLAGPWQWLAAAGASLLAVIAAAAIWRDVAGRTALRLAVVTLGLAAPPPMATGCARRGGSPRCCRSTCARHRGRWRA